MEKRLFRFVTDNDDLINWFDSQKEFASFAIETLNKVRLGELVPSKAASEAKELDAEIKKEKLTNLKLRNRIDAVRADDFEKYHNTFGTTPSPQAQAALNKHAENKTRDFNESEYENVNKYITVKNHNFKWQITCDLCKQGETYDTRLEGIHDMIRHLSTEHTKKVMEMR